MKKIVLALCLVLIFCLGLISKLSLDIHDMNEIITSLSWNVSKTNEGFAFLTCEFPKGLSPEEKVQWFIEHNEPLDHRAITAQGLEDYWLKIAKSMP